MGKEALSKGKEALSKGSRRRSSVDERPSSKGRVPGHAHSVVVVVVGFVGAVGKSALSRILWVISGDDGLKGMIRN